MKYNRKIPYIDMTMLGLLWSINDRLGGGSGIEIPVPNMDWLEDLLEIVQIEAEESEESSRRTRRSHS